MKTQIINDVTYYLPANNDDVIQLVRQAKQNNQRIAVRGSAHSIPLVKTNEKQGTYLYIVLAEMNQITAFDHEKGIVTVQAGCHLGLDPYDPTNISTVANSLVYQLDPFDLTTGKRTQAPGWALPDLGGISHQAIGGFIATGSAGGATKSNFESAIISVDIIHHDGTDAVLKTFNRPVNDDNDPFFGVAFANLGLMGIVVSVTFQCVPSFNIKGTEVTTLTKECDIDLFGDGEGSKLSVQAFFEQPDIFARFMWWPQIGIDKMTVWQAKKADAQTDWQDFKSKPYKDLPFFFGSAKLANILVYYIYTFVDNWPIWLADKLGGNPLYKAGIELLAQKIDPKLMKLILGEFEPNNKPQCFQDIWWNGLPMDNQADDKWLPVWFTELWIPIDQSKAVMNDLKSFFNNPVNAGNFSTEIYAAGGNNFWLSPAYKQDVIRIDVYWFGNDQDGTPEEYYKPFWEELSKYNFRPHWAKYLPAADSEQGVTYLKSQYPMWDSWLKLREQMDPLNLFLTDYWKTHLFVQAE